MKATRLIKSLTISFAIAAVGSAFAATEYAAPAEGFLSSKTRAEVRNELFAARADGSAASSRIDGDENVGARGPAGSRYSKPTRVDIGEALTEYRRNHAANMPNTPNDLYFGS